MINSRLIFLLILTSLFAFSVWGSDSVMAQSKQRSSWEDVWRRIVGRREQDPPLGSRGSGLCLIAPTLTGQVPLPVLWRSQPLFVWQGDVKRIEVYDQAQTLMWQQSIPAARQQIEYQGKPLQAGKTYELKLFTMPPSQRSQRTFFQIMETKQREQINQDLKKLAQKPGLTPIALTLQRADYWSVKGLWEEAIAELYQAKNPSTELQEIQRAIALQTCESGKKLN
ncbi:MAG: DUF928 domain-containing protein [Leptolyngbyaceae cyanobacterium CSU_1_3]|nr:DUF928 domain-containing protein [Leptolyngbyaceae cyanobacterium CSU_1_3]